VGTTSRILILEPTTGFALAHSAWASLAVQPQGGGGGGGGDAKEREREREGAARAAEAEALVARLTERRCGALVQVGL
jgi:hypothetical protein